MAITGEGSEAGEAQRNPTMFTLNLAGQFKALPTKRTPTMSLHQLRLPPDIPRREPIRTPPKVSWADVGLAFVAGTICTLLGMVGAIWIFGG